MLRQRQFAAVRAVLVKRAAWIARRCYSRREFVILRRDLTVPQKDPVSGVPFELRSRTSADLIGLGLPISTHQREIGTWYAGETLDHDICYIQWVGRSEDVLILRSQLNIYPEVGPDEVLLDGAMTPARYRQQGVMSSGMAQLASKLAKTGVTGALTLVGRANHASLRGCNNAGFWETGSIISTYLAFRHRVRVVRSA